jgi:hypothetical protein
MFLLPSEEAAAVGALVVAPLLVHRARVPVTLARRLELDEAVRAGMHALALLSSRTITASRVLSKAGFLVYKPGKAASR